LIIAGELSVDIFQIDEIVVNHHYRFQCQAPPRKPSAIKQRDYANIGVAEKQ
jgi:hypothetical protein